MEFTRKNYFELFRDGVPVIAGGRTSNRHTSLVEAGEHAFEHAQEIASPGEYEVRIDGGLYYMVRIIDLVLDADIDDPGPPPEAQAEFSLDNTAYSGLENTDITFGIVRGIRTDQTLTIDWAITNASVIPNSGTVTFNPGDSTKNITVAAQEVDTNELGDVAIANPIYIGGTFSNPILGSPITATFEIEEVVSGNTHLVPIGTSMSTVRNINASPGDAVLFEAGGTYSVNNDGDRLLCQSGVTYGRYGAGNAPIINSNGSSLSPNQANRFIGVIEINSKQNVIVDGFDITADDDPDSNYFLLWDFESDGSIIRNITCYDSEGGGIVMTRSTNISIEDCEIHEVHGRPHESLTADGGQFINIIRLYSHDNGHAAIAIKSNAKDVDISRCLFEATTNDPMCYIERADRVRVHHNMMRRSSQLIESNPNRKPLNTSGIEGFGSYETRYCRNIEYDHNTIYDADKILQKVNVKGDTYVGGIPLTPHPIFENLHFHHNTLHTGNQLGNSAYHGFHITDLRPSGEQDPEVDWVNLVFENNIVWGIGNAKSIKISNNLPLTVRNILYETGATSDNFGSGDLYDTADPCPGSASGDFTLRSGSNGKNAATDGADIGSGLSIGDVL